MLHLNYYDLESNFVISTTRITFSNKKEIPVRVRCQRRRDKSILKTNFQTAADRRLKIDMEVDWRSNGQENFFVGPDLVRGPDGWSGYARTGPFSFFFTFSAIYRLIVGILT